MNALASITRHLPQLIQGVDRPGSFATGGRLRFYAPRIDIEGVGPLALPLLANQAQALIAAAQPAPYGRGEETVYDAEVRKCWQVDADQVRISGEGWQAGVDALVGRISRELGVQGKVEAELYKLLIYDAGSFFLEHRDTEKRKGMFATLVVVLPSDYTGGELVVRHQEDEQCFDLHGEGPDSAGYAAFYADCRHEVRPITRGHRLTLVYNLLRKGRGKLPKPADYTTEQALAGELLRRWSEAKRGITKRADAEKLPEKLVYPLTHAYTPAALSFDALKGADQARVRLLTEAATRNGCEAHLALVTLEEDGTAEYYGSYGRGRYQDEPDDDDFEIDEILESTRTLDNWHAPDGTAPRLGELSFEEEELCPPEILSSLDGGISFYEATGNEGASFERSYHFAALVLWPKGRIMAIVAQGGPSATIPYLGELTKRWRAAGKEARAPLLQDAQMLSRAILQGLPQEPYERRSLSRAGLIGQLLYELARLDQHAEGAQLFQETLASGLYSDEDNKHLPKWLPLYPADQQAALLAALMQGNAQERPGRCAELLLKLARARRRPTAGTLEGAGRILAEAIPGMFSSRQRRGWTPYAEPLEPKSLVTLLHALLAIEPQLAQRAVAHLLDTHSGFDLDQLLLPAALLLRKGDKQPLADALVSLYQALRAHLEQRIALPLAPPEDWRRPAELSCSCPACQQLAAFLADPEQEEWRYVAAERRRQHLADIIRAGRCDLDLTTLKQGRPYTLLCRKNQNSYQRRVEQRTQDQHDLLALDR